MPSTATSILDGLSTSVAVKAPCRTVATSNITLAGLQTISGYTTVENDRVLVKGQTDAVDNGIYMASTGSWTRAKDADGNRDLVQGTLVLVRSATSDGNLWELTTANPIVIGTTELTFELRDDPTVTYAQNEDEIAAGLTPANTTYPPGHVLRWAANSSPGVTDMTLAFQRVALTSLEPYAPAGLYLITGSIPLRDNQHWKLDGARISITGTTVQVFTVAAGIDDWSIRGNWSVIGDNGAAGATSGTAAAIAITDSERWRVEGLVAKNIKGYGVLIQPGSSTSGRAEHGMIIAPIIDACYRGMQIEAGTGAEYVNVTAPLITNCNIGILTAAGNTNVVGGSITDNTDNVKIIAGNNHAHGIFSSVNINHATQYLVHCEDVVNGQTFVGCHLYANDTLSHGAIFLDECKGIQFIGGHLDCHLYNYKGASSGLNIIRDMYCPGGYGLKRLPGTNNGHDELLIINCFGPGSIAPSSDALDTAGVSMNDPAFMFVLAKRVAASTQSLTSGVAADLLFNTEVSDRRGAYNPATGITTIPAAQGGIYRIRGDLVFSGTAMSATASIVELKIGSTSYRLFTPTINSTTRLMFSICSDIYLNAAETVKLTATITGTTPVHGDATYESSLTVERLS